MRMVYLGLRHSVKAARWSGRGAVRITPSPKRNASHRADTRPVTPAKAGAHRRDGSRPAQGWRNAQFLTRQCGHCSLGISHIATLFSRTVISVFSKLGRLRPFRDHEAIHFINSQRALPYDHFNICKITLDLCDIGLEPGNRASNPGSGDGPPVSAIPSPGRLQQMGVVEGAVAISEPGSAGDRALDIAACAVDGALDFEALGKAGGDRRGEGAASAVGVAGVDPRALPNPGPRSGHQDVRDGAAGEVPA